MTNEEMGNCPKCRKLFVGAVEVTATEIEGIATIVLEETPDRNWIQCDLCSLVICKGCCTGCRKRFFATVACSRKKAPF